MRNGDRASLLPLERAQDIVLESVELLEPEEIPLGESMDRFLAQDLIADVDIPSVSLSAMDGYAVVAEETKGASPNSPRTLSIVEEIRAGALPRTKILPGVAAKIMTGAPIPPGADAVIMVECAQSAGDRVEIMAEVEPGENVRPRGEDVTKGEVVLEAGTRVGPAQLGMMAALGQEKVSVRRRPEAIVMTTGDELVDVDKPLPKGKLRDSNRYTLRGQLRACGALIREHHWVKDDPRLIRDLLLRAEDVDAIVTSGGVSMGKYDLVKEVVREAGQVLFWRVAIKPGKPTLFGKIGRTPVFALPGNPVSSMVVFELLFRPAFLRMAGCREIFRPVSPVRVLEQIDHERGRREFVRARTSFKNGEWVARPTGSQSSGVLTSMCRANSLLIVPEEVDTVKQGEILRAILLDAFLNVEVAGGSEIPYGA